MSCWFPADRGASPPTGRRLFLVPRDPVVGNERFKRSTVKGMGKSKKRKKRNKPRIESYKKTGKKLVPPLASYPYISPIDYNASILPNLLWIEAVRDFYGDQRFISVIYTFLDMLDDSCKEISETISGLVQSFDYVPSSTRIAFVNNNPKVVQSAVIEPFANVLSLYPRCPMAWLASHYHGELPKFDLDSTLSSLKRWTRNLIDRTGQNSNMARAVVFARYLKDGKLKLPVDKELIDELVRYPNCKDRKLTESWIRSMTNLVWDSDIQNSTWGQDFWETNGRISICAVKDDDRRNTLDGHDGWLSELSLTYSEEASRFLKAVKRDYLKYSPDTSNFEKISVIAGLLSRTTAFLLDVLTQRSLWVGEIGGIILRCLCETLILSSWIITKDDIALYKKFVLYSLGQADLYGLKIEGYERYREVFKSLYLGDDATVDDLAKDDWASQLRTINLGNWAGLDTRKMAEEGGTKHYYDLIFTQCSSDLHSQFMSLARWNMTTCDNPLHNFHLLPTFGERRINPFLPLTACVLGKETCDRIFKHLGVDAECVKILENLLESISKKVLSKTYLADGSRPEAEVK